MTEKNILTKHYLHTPENSITETSVLNTCVLYVVGKSNFKTRNCIQQLKASCIEWYILLRKYSQLYFRGGGGRGGLHHSLGKMSDLTGNSLLSEVC